MEKPVKSTFFAGGGGWALLRPLPLPFGEWWRDCRAKINRSRDYDPPSHSGGSFSLLFFYSFFPVYAKRGVEGGGVCYVGTAARGRQPNYIRIKIYRDTARSRERKRFFCCQVPGTFPPSRNIQKRYFFSIRERFEAESRVLFSWNTRGPWHILCIRYRYFPAFLLKCGKAK